MEDLKNKIVNLLNQNNYKLVNFEKLGINGIKISLYTENSKYYILKAIEKSEEDILINIETQIKYIKDSKYDSYLEYLLKKKVI